MSDTITNLVGDQYVGDHSSMEKQTTLVVVADLIFVRYPIVGLCLPLICRLMESALKQADKKGIVGRLVSKH